MLSSTFAYVYFTKRYYYISFALVHHFMRDRVVCFMVSVSGHKINCCTDLKYCDKDRIGYSVMAIVEEQLRQLSQSVK